MAEPKSEQLTEEMRVATANTAPLPRILPGADHSEEEFRLGQSRILEMIAAGAPLGKILEHLLLLIEAQSPDMLCSVLLLSDDGNHIRHGAAPSLPEDYVKAIDGAPIGPKHGSCGTAMYRGQRVVVDDVMSDPLWEDFRDLASAAGLRACWSTPILSGRGKVLGSFAMYYREPRSPTGEEAGLTEVATRIAGLAIEHQAARETLARAQSELAQAVQSATHSLSAETNAGSAAAIDDEITSALKTILNNANTGLKSLDEPDVANLRVLLTRINTDARHALEVISGVRTPEKD